MTVPNITGALHRFSDGRLVFLGRSADDPGTWYVGFQNLEGHVIKLKISEETMTILSEMLASYPPEDPVPFTPRSDSSLEYHWRLVEKKTDE